MWTGMDSGFSKGGSELGKRGVANSSIVSLKQAAPQNTMGYIISFSTKNL